jgi:hypothetical protein
MTYRLDLPTPALAFRGKHQAATTILAGQIVEVIGPVDDARFYVVTINGAQFHMFVVDLADRGK